MRRALATALLCLLPIATTAHADDTAWWRHAVVYEIYPRSFQDSNGDGVGDLNGVTQRLDYLAALGVDALWLTPIYPSPQVDFGYDIADYEAIDPQYGTLADFDRLVGEAKKRKMRVVMDLVLNHTSDQHAWWKAAASSRKDPKHDFYVWSDGKLDGSGKRVPPNNWVSQFGGSAWQWVPAVQQFYYHQFYRQQPDLNFRNPAVEAAMQAVARFWLDRGVAGFRLDAVPELFEDAQLRDEPVAGPGTNSQGDPYLVPIYTNNLPEAHDVLRRLRAVLDKYPGDRVLIGETYLPSTAALDAWYGGAKQDELELPMDMIIGFHGDKDVLDVPRFRARLTEIETKVHGGQPLIVFDNHDNVRSWDRYGDGKNDAGIARALATLLLTVRGTALMYYGQELGMRTTRPTRKEDVRDPIGITGWPRQKGRDGERTPMQWDASNAQAGFSTNAKPWLPVPPSAQQVNVKSELADPDSLLVWYRHLIALRRTLPALRDGNMTFVEQKANGVLSYLRASAAGARVVMVINMTAQPAAVSVNPWTTGPIRVLLSDDPKVRAATTGDLTLAPYASIIAEVGVVAHRPPQTNQANQK